MPASSGISRLSFTISNRQFLHESKSLARKTEATGVAQGTGKSDDTI
jgi:hypothetical protein